MHWSITFWAFIQWSCSIQFVSCWPPYRSDCTVVINEINVEDSAPHGQFVELKRACPFATSTRTLHLEYFKLVVVNAAGELVVVCHLQGKQDSKYYVIGSLFNEANFQYENCHRAHNHYGFLPRGGTNEPFGVGLLYEKSKSFDKFSLTDISTPGVTRYASKEITKGMFKELEKKLVDFYVVASTTGYVSCEVFGKIVKSYQDYKHTLLRDLSSDNEVSISRCSDGILRFQPPLFKVAPPTPNRPNNCDPNVAKPFWVEDFLRLDESEKVLIPNDSPVGKRCFSIPTLYNQQVGYLATQEVIDNAMEADPAFDPDLDTSQLLPVVEPMDVCDSSENRDPGSSQAANTEPPDGIPQWKKCRPPPTPAELERLSKQKIMDVGLFSKPDTCNWLQYISNSQSISCTLCTELYHDKVIFDRPGSAYVDGFMTGVGKPLVLNTHNSYRNKQRVQKHLTDNPLHKLSNEIFELMSTGLSKEEALKKVMEGNSLFVNYLNATIQLVRVVYQANRMGLAFNTFRLLTDLLKYNGANLGFLHQNADGMQTITRHISDTMNKTLLNYINNDSPYVSVMLDSSTDRGGLSIVSILFYTFHQRIGPKLYYYTSVHLKEGEKGAQIFKVFKDQIENDEINTALQNSLISVCTDGASSMVNTFRVALNAYFRNQVTGLWCSNHRLELVMKSALKKRPYIQVVQSLINELAAFFNRQAAKRRTVLRKYSKILNRNFQLHRILAIRWARSTFIAMKNILNNWEIILQALSEIETSTEFDNNARGTATRLKGYLLDHTFISYLAFLTDIHYTVSKYSLRLQREDTTLIGDFTYRKLIVDEISFLSNTSGTFALMVVNQSDIEGEDIGNFEADASTFRGIRLRRLPENGDHRLYESIGSIVQDIVEKFKHYFTETFSFDVLDPQHIEANKENLDYGVSEISEINRVHGWGLDDAKLRSGWVALKPTIISQIAAEKASATDSLGTPFEFWTNCLRKVSLPWKPEIRQFIEKTLVIHISSSSVERMFSIYNVVKTSQRNLLTPENVDAILRLRVNGPSDLRKFDADFYAKQFILEHSRSDDKSRRKPQNELIDKDSQSLFDPMFNIDEDVPEELVDDVNEVNFDS